MQPPKPATPPHRVPALDGLRGLAVLLVIAYHYSGQAHLFFPGWAGVDLFFVLSGYLITQRLNATKGRPHYFSHFYRNRAVRILPLYYTLVLAFLLAIDLFVSAKNLPTLQFYPQHWKSFLIFTQNWTFARFGTPTDLSLVPLWSIAVEVQFYLCWPTLIYLVPNPKFSVKLFPILLLLVLLARSIFYLTHPASEYQVYFNSFFRMDGFLLGSLLCQIHQARITISAKLIKYGMAILLLIFATVAFLTKNTTPFNPFYSTIGYTLVAVFFTGLLHLVSQPATNALDIFFNHNFLRHCGRISYCLYLIHFPFLYVAYSRTLALAPAWWPSHLFLYRTTAICSALLLSFLLSTLSFRYFESRFLRLKK